MERSRILMLTIAGLVFLLSALPIIRHLTRASDIWWTPKALTPSLNDVADRVEVYIRGERLDEHIKSGRLQLLGSAGPATVIESDVRFRFNNWDRVRAQGIPVLLAPAALLGASCVGLLLGIAGWTRVRKDRTAA